MVLVSSGYLTTLTSTFCSAGTVVPGSSTREGKVSHKAAVKARMRSLHEAFHLPAAGIGPSAIVPDLPHAAKQRSPPERDAIKAPLHTPAAGFACAGNVGCEHKACARQAFAQRQ